MALKDTQLDAALFRTVRGKTARRLTDEEFSTITSALDCATERYKEWAHSLRHGEFAQLRGSSRLAEQFDRQVADIEKLLGALSVCGLQLRHDGACEMCLRSNVEIARLDAAGATVCIYCDSTQAEDEAVKAGGQ